MPTRKEFDDMREEVRQNRLTLQKAQEALKTSEFKLAKAEEGCRHREETTHVFEEIIEPGRPDPWGGWQNAKATGTYRKVAVHTCQLCGRVERVIPPY